MRAGDGLSRSCNRRRRIHVAHDSPLHAKDEARHMPRHCLPQSGSKLVHQVHARIIAHRRTDVSDWVGVRTRPVRTGSIVCRKGRQHAHNVGGVHAPPSHFIARNQDPGGRVRSSPQQAILRRGLIARRLLFRERRVEILPQERSRLVVRLRSFKHERGSRGQRC